MLTQNHNFQSLLPTPQRPDQPVINAAIMTNVWQSSLKNPKTKLRYRCNL